MNRDELLRERLSASLFDAGNLVKALADLHKHPPEAGAAQEAWIRGVETCLDQAKDYCLRLTAFKKAEVK